MIDVATGESDARQEFLAGFFDVVLQVFKKLRDVAEVSEVVLQALDGFVDTDECISGSQVRIDTYSLAQDVRDREVS